MDRELYVPRSWTCDTDRCREAGLGKDIVFATKPEPARTTVERFLGVGHRVDWVAGDEVCGCNPKLRSTLEERGLGYVLAVACSAEVTTDAGKFRSDTLAAKIPKRAWQKLSAGTGAKGNRFYDWAVIDLAEPGPGHRQLLIRRNRMASRRVVQPINGPELAGHASYFDRLGHSRRLTGPLRVPRQRGDHREPGTGGRSA